jgi:phosphatidate phosphatase APP1
MVIGPFSFWNIYDYLQAFLLHNGFPVGEVILRDVDMKLLKSREIEAYNKYIEIEKILIAFSETNFTLIGDTGEKDFNIYIAITEKYPDRIERIILNNAGNKEKIAEVKKYVGDKVDEKIVIVDGYKEMV